MGENALKNPTKLSETIETADEQLSSPFHFTLNKNRNTIVGALKTFMLYFIFYEKKLYYLVPCEFTTLRAIEFYWKSSHYVNVLFHLKFDPIC